MSWMAVLSIVRFSDLYTNSVEYQAITELCLVLLVSTLQCSLMMVKKKIVCLYIAVTLRCEIMANSAAVGV